MECEDGDNLGIVQEQERESFTNNLNHNKMECDNPGIAQEQERESFTYNVNHNKMEGDDGDNLGIAQQEQETPMVPTGFHLGKKISHFIDSRVGDGLKQFYSGGARYWEDQEATDNGMLGGLGHLSRIELQNSEQFLKSLFKITDPPGQGKALDCGAGIGRITKNLLQRFFQVTDLVDQDSKFIEQARENLKSSPKVGQFYCTGLQAFVPTPKEYDVIWCQWVLCYMTDEDLVRFLKRCCAGLKPNGVMVIKENTTRGTDSAIDESDSSVTRSFNAFMDAFKAADMKVLKYVKQKNFPRDLYPVWVWGLKPNEYS